MSQCYSPFHYPQEDLDFLHGLPTNHFPAPPIHTGEDSIARNRRPRLHRYEADLIQPPWENLHIPGPSQQDFHICYCHEVPGPYGPHLHAPVHPVRRGNAPARCPIHDPCYCDEIQGPHSLVDIHVSQRPESPPVRPSHFELRYGTSEAVRIRRHEANNQIAAAAEAQRASSRFLHSQREAESEAERASVKTSHEQALFGNRMKARERGFNEVWENVWKGYAEDVRRAKLPPRRPSQFEFQYGLGDTVERSYGTRSRTGAEIAAQQASTKARYEVEDAEIKRGRGKLPVEPIEIRDDLRKKRERQERENLRERQEVRGEMMGKVGIIIDKTTSAIEAKTEAGEFVTGQERGEIYRAASDAFAEMLDEFGERFYPLGTRDVRTAKWDRPSTKIEEEELPDLRNRQEKTLFRQEMFNQMKREKEARDQAELLARYLDSRMHIGDTRKHPTEAGNKTKMETAQDTNYESWKRLGEGVSKIHCSIVVFAKKNCTATSNGLYTRRDR